jgi:hypothetical protein
MEITINNIYDYLQENKKNLNFKQRDDVVTECGTSKFQTLFYDKKAQFYDIPEEVKNFLIKSFNIQERDYHFLQIQKYEVGDYILPHKDCYPQFALLHLSTSSLDGLTLEDHEGKYKFLPDIAGNLVQIPKYRWHWVNPVREKTRYTAVYGLNPLKDYDTILDQ